MALVGCIFFSSPHFHIVTGTQTFGNSCFFTLVVGAYASIGKSCSTFAGCFDHANSAVSCAASFVDVSGFWREFVPVDAVCLRCLVCCGSVTPKRVDLRSYRFKMFWITAVADSTKMIYHKVFRNITYKGFVDKPVNSCAASV